MELACDGLLNRYLIVALQNAVFGAEFQTICKAVSCYVVSRNFGWKSLIVKIWPIFV